MEDIIWVFVGVVTMLLVLGVMAGLIQTKFKDDMSNTAASSLDTLVFHCDSVCNMPKDTFISFPVDFVRDMAMNGEQNSICMTYKEKKSCRRCLCDVAVVTLNLTDAPFNAHKYECFYLKGTGSVALECTG